MTNICEWTWLGEPRCTRPAVGKVNGTVPICRECASRANLDRVVFTTRPSEGANRARAEQIAYDGIPMPEGAV